MSEAARDVRPAWTGESARDLSRWGGAVFAAAATLLILAGMLARFAYPDGGYRAAFFDDFYYYLVVGEHFVHDGILSFDGVVPTNGYHPLWLALIIGLLEITGRSSVVFFLLLSLLIAGFTLAFLYFMVRAARLVAGGDMLALAPAFHGAFFLFILGKSGMEVSGACCAVALLIWRLLALPFPAQTLRQAAVTGFIASVMVLARLDTALFVVCVCVVLMVAERARLRPLLARAAAFAAGGVLVPAYLVADRILFGLWMPVSGQAKQLRSGFSVSLHSLASLFEVEPGNIAFVFPGIAIDVVALTLLVSGRPRGMSPHVRAIAFAVLAFAPAYYVMQALASDWHLWSWYLYPFAPVLAIGGAVCIGALPRAAWPVWVRPVAVAGVVGFAALYLGARELSRPPSSNFMYMAGLDVQRFAQTHPGVYAMGDRAGTVAYLLGTRVVQTEGLVMDGRFLDNIRQRRNLIDVLRDYGVAYHIATNPVLRDGCWDVEEPLKAGPTSPRMSARFCEQPLLRVHYPGYTTMIFQVPAA